ncbi:MAG: hypothetical protein JXQ71_08180 [Verrucomicrobia bacterium]|nr:hypothetical protein [Verrucomicrobiota bacterium]
MKPSPSAPPRPINADLTRRDFLRAAGGAATGLMLSRLPLVAGPFSRTDFEKLVPADKKLRPDWVKSLTARGTREVYRWPESRLVGMPVGGIGAGQLYLGGDGKLWHWDIFNQVVSTGAEHYAKPMSPASPLDQGFAVRIDQAGQSQVRALDHTGWRDLEFLGEYPVGLVTYRDPASPLEVSLEAFSPFIPLNPEDSALPATVLRFTLKNTSAAPARAELAGWLQNAVCLHTASPGAGRRLNRIVRRHGFTFLECTAEALPAPPRAAKRPDIVVDDFEGETYAGWTVEGTAFGHGPVSTPQIPDYQGDVRAHGQRTVNSHATAPGADVAAKDAATGALTSKSFAIERDYLTFLIGGGSHKDRTCIRLLVDERPVLSATGRNHNRMQPHTWDVRPWSGTLARLQILDREQGAWGNVGIDHIVLTDTPPTPQVPLADQFDFGSMGLALLNPRTPAARLESQSPPPPSPTDAACTMLPPAAIPAGLFSAPGTVSDAPATQPFGQTLTGSLTRRVTLAPGESATITFVLTWHFPNLKLAGLGAHGGRWYGTRFPDALGVARHVAQHFDRLADETRRWHDTWYDSTLPYWFLDRTMAPTSHLATSTCHWLGNGRFYGWEGVGCCPGTCTHVWHYAHAVARLFPPLERSLREMADYGAGFDPETGRIRFRAEHNDHWAADGQAGVILRTCREHQMSADSAFLRRVWPRARKALEFLIAQDRDANGILEGAQHNTLDADWHGPVAWLSGLYLAALRAGETMAAELGDDAFARRCRGIFERGRLEMVRTLFNGEYFINQPDPKHSGAINSGTGCHIDQVLGQSWAFQVGLGRVLPEKETRGALEALWRYNFTPDVAPWRAANQPGRWYAMAGEGGLIMCTFPRADWDYAKAAGKGPGWAAGYFNECMNGFEYQVAGHMLAEGMLQQGLAITRMIHDRYHPARRNPWNEVECGDHYARSMASYGVFLAATGYEYHGPQGHLGFAPRLTPEDFKCAFTTAQGWGSYHQQVQQSHLTSQLSLHWGQLRLRTFAATLPPPRTATRVAARLRGNAVAASLEASPPRTLARFDPAITLHAGDVLELQWTR